MTGDQDVMVNSIESSRDAAFDTIDHDVLITRLSSWFGIHGFVLSWFKSYLSFRCFRVKCETDLSS